MEREKQIVCIFVVFLILPVIIAPVSAMTVSFVDEAYLKANDYSITDQSGNFIENWTGSHTVTLPEGKSYSVMFNSNGIVDLVKQSPGDYSFLETVLNFVKTYIVQLVVVGAILCLVILWRH